MSAEPEDGETVELHAVFRGRVQGVGFRATVKHYATKLGVVGSVKNLSDGSVELYAQAPRSVLQLLIRNLQDDAGLGTVNEVTQDITPPRRELRDFRILF